MENSSDSFDLIVAGCGIAGLSAAVSAAQSTGVRVLVLERSRKEERGGNTRYTDAFMRMKNHAEVADDFVDHLSANASLGHVFPHLMAELTRDREQWPPQLKSLNFSDPELIGAFASNAGPTIQWLESFGIRFDMMPIFHLTGSTERFAPIGGGHILVETLATYAEENGITFLYETSAQNLVLADDGSIAGVEVIGRTSRRRIHGKAIILACGGFEGNYEMMARYIGPQSIRLRPLAKGGYYNKGEGIRMALDIGAAPAGDYSQFHAGPADPRSSHPDAGVYIFPYGILVNTLAKRFVDEAPGPVDRTYENIVRKILYQPGNLAYAIVDAKISDVPGYTRSLRTDQPPIQAETVEKLAKALDIPATDLIGTVKEYNASCPAGGAFSPLEMDGLKTEGLNPPKSNFARPLDTPPYSAYPVICANTFTFGGLKVDENARVINTNGVVIPGLYAAGEVIGLYYGDYTGATSVLRGAVFGRLAGRHAASQIHTGNGK